MLKTILTDARMKSKEPFSLRKRIASFRFALNGIKILLKEEHNARIHLVISGLVLLGGFFFQLNLTEWLMVTITIGFVFAMELINSAIENLADVISPDKDDRIKRIKDLAAAAVLFSAFISVVVGLIIFLPKILNLVSHGS